MKAARRDDDEQVSAKPLGSVHARLADLYEALAEEHRKLSFADAGDAPRPARKRPERPAPKFKLVPSETQREKAKRILRAKGLIDE